MNFIDFMKKNGISYRDRRGIAPYSNGSRTMSISKIAIHHSGANVDQTSETLENYWCNTLGWGTGGYHVVIRRDKDATVEWNYDADRISNGVGNHNGYIFNISVEGNGNFTDKQNANLKLVTRFWKDSLGLPYTNIWGHNEFSGHYTNACPGRNMDDFRNQINAMAPAWKTQATIPAAAESAVPARYAVSYSKLIAYPGYSIDSKPYGEAGAEWWGKTDDFVGQVVPVVEENGSREYLNTSLGWIDKRALIDVPGRISISYNVIIKAKGFSIDSKPWGEPGFKNWGSTDEFIGETVPATETNASGEYINTSLGWLDRRAVEREPVVVSSTLHLPAGQTWIVYPENGPYKAGNVIAIEQACSCLVLGDKGQGLIVVDLEGGIGCVAIRYDESKGASIEKTYSK